MSNHEHSQHLLSAERAREGLAADLRNMNEAGESLIRHGSHDLKRTAITHGAAMLGGLVVGLTWGRVATGRRGSPVLGELLGRAMTTLATAIASQLVATLLKKRS